MISFSARLPNLYMEKEPFWLSSMQDWLWTAWRLPPSTAIFQPHQDQFVYVSSPCLPANGEITASFFNSVCLTCEVWRCNTQMWLVQALDLGLQALLLDGNRHISRWDFQDERNSPHCFCWWERWNGGLHKLRASIKRTIEAAEVAISWLSSPTTCTLPFSFHSSPLPSFQSPVCHNISLNIPIS